MKSHQKLNPLASWSDADVCRERENQDKTHQDQYSRQAHNGLDATNPTQMEKVSQVSLKTQCLQLLIERG